MSNLGFLERTLGSFNSWSQDILRYLFLVTPTHYTTLELAAFFFGNNIPRITALDFFHECRNPTPKIVDIFCSKYDTWERRPDCDYMYEYYDMRIGQIVELSGSAWHGHYVVIERERPLKLGFDHDLFPSHVMRRIEAMRGDNT